MKNILIILIGFLQTLSPIYACEYYGKSWKDYCKIEKNEKTIVEGICTIYPKHKGCDQITIWPERVTEICLDVPNLSDGTRDIFKIRLNKNEETEVYYPRYNQGKTTFDWNDKSFVIDLDLGTVNID